MTPGPSASIVADAQQEFEISDTAGRRLRVRPLGALGRLRLFKAVGAELADNAPYLGMAMLAASVVSIDDIPVPPPNNETHLESIIQRLGDAGLAAVSRTILDDPGPTPELTTAGN